MNPIRPTLAALWLGSLALFFGCNSKPQPTERSPEKPGFAYQFAPKAVTSLMIEKSDPGSGESWNARLEKMGLEDDSWEIRSGDWIDRVADGGFIAHLLDTLTTLQTQPSPLNGDLASFGLDPPRMALRWSVPGQTSLTAYDGELIIGSPINPKALTSPDEVPESYVIVKTGDAGTPPPVAVAVGSALRMMEHLQTFDSIRLRRLATFTSDEVDELTMSVRGKKVLYAQRDGAAWTDSKHRAIKAQVGDLLEMLLHLQIAHFADDPKENTELLKSIEKSPQFEFTFSGRRRTATKLRISGVTASWSLRPGAAFILYPGAKNHLEEWKKRFDNHR